MNIVCQKCGHWRIEIFFHDGSKPHGKCVCRKCGETWFIEPHNLFKEGDKNTMSSKHEQPSGQNVEIFGFQVPTRDYYLHPGHTWAILEDTGNARVGLDAFSQKIFGPADEVRLPEIGKTYYQGHICLSLVRQGRKASFVAPVDGVVLAVNPRVRENPGLVHDAPYDEGWLFKVRPINLRRNLDNLITGEAGPDWMHQESHRLIKLMESEIGLTVPDGGTFIDDIIGNYPQLGWRPLVQEFLLTSLAREWKKRS